MIERKYVLLALLFPLLLACSDNNPGSPEGVGGNDKKNVTYINGTHIDPETTLCGLIYDVQSGAGIPDVVVSDGFNCTLTDANGVTLATFRPNSAGVRIFRLAAPGGEAR